MTAGRHQELVVITGYFGKAGGVWSSEERAAVTLSKTGLNRFKHGGASLGHKQRFISF